MDLHPLGARLARVRERSVHSPVQLDDDLWTVPIPMPSKGLAYNLCIVSADAGGRLTLVDPGWSTPDAMTALELFLSSISRRIDDVDQVILTHGHVDHAGLAPEIRSRSGARIALHVAESAPEPRMPEDAEALLVSWGVDDDLRARLLEHLLARPQQIHPLIGADIKLHDDERVPGGSNWRVVHTPGHTPGHICLVDEDRRIVLSGDHLLPDIYPGLGLGGSFSGNAIEATLDSLDKLHRYDDFRVVPGHGYPFASLRSRRIPTRSHILRRAHELHGIVSRDRTLSISSIAARMTWSGGWPAVVAGPMLLSSLRQTALYREFVESRGLRRWT